MASPFQRTMHARGRSRCRERPTGERGRVVVCKQRQQSVALSGRSACIHMATLSPEKTHPVVGKDELIHQIAAKASLTLKETSKVIDAFTEVVREEIAQDHEVRLMGFGTWNLRPVAER